VKNAYLEQVMEEQKVVERDLKRKKRAAPRRLDAPQIQAMGNVAPEDDFRSGSGGGGDADDNGPDHAAVDVRITGWWRWRNVIVPPNAYVVHTRRGRQEPLHVGLGISFGFDPVKDSFLVVPAAMQTIVISANCICKERQGILVQGYVQWIIADFPVAYKKLDFNDPIEPMKVVNVQLREQAEAAIKDTVATMSIDDVLSDKQPIIQELTARLRQVAEGDNKDEGLGLRIVTVQIKEAVVSSPTVWENLQAPFRAERAKEARLAQIGHQSEVDLREAEIASVRAAREKESRLAELGHEDEVNRRESEGQRAQETRELEGGQAVARRRAELDAEAFEREQQERVRRAELEQQALDVLAQHARAKLESDSAVARLQLELELAREQLRADVTHTEALREVELDRARRAVENDVSEARLRELLVESLPEVAERMPKPAELKQINLGGAEGPAALLEQLTRVLDAVRGQPAS
jgi:SPFH domain / Band 7 family